MAALESDLKRVLADQAHVLDPQLFRGEVLDACQAARRSGFTATLGARACPPELFSRVNAAVAVLPRDLHHLALAVDVDVEWKRVAVLQVLYRPLPDVDDGQLTEGLD
jgi:hypothetical protein